MSQLPGSGSSDSSTEGGPTLLEATLAAITMVSEEARAEAERRQANLSKPPGSLGVLETVGNRLSAIAGQCPPPIPEPVTVGIFAGDHGVVAQQVTPWPQEITAQMLVNIAAGGAAINVLARQMGACTMLTDVGVASAPEPLPGVRIRRVRSGTGDLSVEPAMTQDEARTALEVGIEAANEAIDGGARCLVTGEMGIGNTTPASALIAVFTGSASAEVTGAGAGSDADMLTHKAAVIQRALDLHRPDAADPVGVLSAVGGLEHAAIAGFILGAAARRVPVVLDGVIACSAACAAVALSPAVRGYLLSGHAGAEPGIRVALQHLGLEPLVDLGLRLGEGTGAVLAVPLVQGAARILGEMATFDDLGAPVSRRSVALVLGGARSGKSTWAEDRFADRDDVDYVATSRRRPDDAEWVERVRIHTERRPKSWRTVETTDLVGVLSADSARPVIVDCLAVWLTRMLEETGAWEETPGWQDRLEAHTSGLVQAVANTAREVVLVSNEVGSGVVPPTVSGRVFRDELGKLNAAVAAASDEAWMCEVGIARRLG